MGDQNGVDTVQALHVDLLSAGGAIADIGLIRYRHSIPDTWVLGVYRRLDRCKCSAEPEF